MDGDTKFGWVIHFAIALYIGFWYNSVIPILLTSQTIDYNFIGICGALMCLAASAIIFSNRNINKYLLVISVILSALLYIVSILYRSFWLIGVISIFHGILIGAIVTYSLQSNQLKKAMPYWSLGLFFSILSYFCSLKFTNGVEKNSNSSLYNADICFGTITAIVLLLVIIALLLIKSNKETNLSSITKINNTSSPTILGYLITGGLIMIEISFIYWSLVLKDESQGWAYQLTFPLTLLLLFLFRQYFISTFSKFYNIGWLFVSVLFITLGLGLFYTFSFTPIFILLFSKTMAFAIGASIQIFQQHWNSKSISILLLCVSVSMIIGGLYVQNHIEFILSINMPKDVLHLSANQAWIKELASLAGIITVLTAYVFLRRRSFAFLKS